jgi:hypothetical protein
MSRRIHGGGIAAAALALALALSAPAHAAGLSGWEPASGLLLRAWHWLAGGWAAPAAEPQGRAGAGRSTMAKEGPGIDPMGGHSLETGSTTGSTPTSAGTTVDSNGG